MNQADWGTRSRNHDLYRELIEFVRMDVQSERHQVNRRMFSVFFWCFLIPAILSVCVLLLIKFHILPHRARGFLDWGGGLVWLAGPATAETHAAVEQAARHTGGTWTLLRAPGPLRSAVRVVLDEAEPLARITRRVKAAFDPGGILNPGRIYAGL